MARIQMTGGFTLMDEGVQVVRIYGVDYKETFGNLTIYMVNAKGQTLRETFRFKMDGKANEGAMNAFSYFAKTAMDDFQMEDLDPQDLVGRYIQVEIVHNQYNGRNYANLGRDKSVAYEFDEDPVPEALTMSLTAKEKPVKVKETQKPAPKPVEDESDIDLDDLLNL